MTAMNNDPISGFLKAVEAAVLDLSPIESRMGVSAGAHHTASRATPTSAAVAQGE